MTSTFKYRTRKLRRGFKKFSLLFFLVLIVVFVLVVFNIADLFSSVITNKGSLLYGEKIRIPNTIYYGMSVYNSSSKEKCKEKSKEVIKQGGAGCLYQMGDYFVLTSIYLSHEEAREIKENLSKIDSVKIININVPVININYKGNHLSDNNEMFLTYNKLFKKLYDLSINYDTGNISSVEVKKEVGVISSEFGQKIANFDAIYKKEKYEFQNKLLKSLKDIKIEIDNLLTCDSVELMLNSKIKEVYCNIVLEFYNLAKII